MASVICGSVAYDTIMTFDGHFREHILPDKIHILNVSFLVPSMRREFGGCAGNIAYTLKLLGGEPIVMATVGQDAAPYLDYLKTLGISTTHIKEIPGTFTAQAMITTDRDNNQITAFHPGAMNFSHQNHVADATDVAIGIVAPDGRDAMIDHAAQLAAAKIPFVFDPGQGLPMFDGDELRRFTTQASWVAVNDYEARMLCERMDTTLEALSRQANLRGVIVTLAHDGCELWQDGQRTHVPGVAATEVLDPTGCGDALRGALLHGLSLGWTLARCMALGNQVGAIKIAQRGGQNHRIPAALVAAA